ncbi:MAG: M23 family metallopeptidase [Tenuifilaceae bacterium]|nr:M23 family metallopeptidase [Tenuifilaceae bacterium]
MQLLECTTMAKEKSKKHYIHKLKSKYRLSILNDQTFEEVWVMRLSRLNVIVAVGATAIFLITAVILLIAFTPMREFIPGYPDGNTRRSIVENALKTDSLERELRQWKIYLGNLHTILRGENPNNMESIPDTSIRYSEINFARSIEDSLLRMQIETEELYNLSVIDSRSDRDNLTRLHFFPPVKGVVTNPFNAKSGHLGVDVVAPPNEVIVAVADGTVTLSSWTLETGYVIQIQHAGNLLSVYKHNSKLLKQSGAHVKTGEAIAIIGNSGELTTGPHLHFELWHKGTPLNPEQYIVF